MFIGPVGWELVMLDLVLAIVHHVLIFGIFGILSAELMAVRPDMSSATALRIASIDSLYGIFAAAVVIIGFCRAIFAAKGWAYYSHNAFFWAKIITFAGIGLLSVPPTMVFIRWRKAGVALTTPASGKSADMCTSNLHVLSYC